MFYAQAKEVDHNYDVQITPWKEDDKIILCIDEDTRNAETHYELTEAEALDLIHALECTIKGTQTL